MSVSNTNTIAQYTGDGATTTFGLTASGNPIPYFAAADWVVNLFDTVANANVAPQPMLGGAATYDYTIATTATDAFTGELTGNIIFNTAPLGTHRVTAERDVAATSSNNFLDNSKFPAVSVNAQLDRTMMVAQRAINLAARSLSRALSDAVAAPVTLPPDALLRGNYLGFDSGGNPVALVAPIANTSVSAALVPAVTAASVALARAALGLGAAAVLPDPIPIANGGTGATTFPSLTNTRLAKTAAYTVVNGDKGKTIALAGVAFYGLGFSAPAGYDANFSVLVVNEDAGRGKNIQLTGGTNFILWPGQSCIVFNQNNVWKVTPSAQRWIKSGAVFYVDPVNGNDGSDGLGTSGAGSFLTIQGAYNAVRNNLDAMGGLPTIQLLDGTHNVGSGVNLNYALVGSAQMLITGNNVFPGNVIIACSAGGSCFVARDGGVTVTLSGMTLTTIGNGSTLLSATQNAVLDICSSGPVNFGAAPLGLHMSAQIWSSINVLGSYLISGGAANHLSCAYGAYINYGSFTVTGVSNLTFSSGFVAVSQCGVVTAGGVPMTFSGFGAITGGKYNVSLNGVINSGGAVFPGSTAGVTSTGGQYS